MENSFACECVDRVWGGGGGAAGGVGGLHRVVQAVL